MEGIDVAKLLIEYGPKALMAIGVGLLVIYIKKWWLGLVFILVGASSFTYQAWEARRSLIEVTNRYERSRDQLKTDIGYDDKTALFFVAPPYQNGLAVKLVYRGLRGPTEFVYPCPDGGKCEAMRKYYGEVKLRQEPFIKEDWPSPHFGDCRTQASWQALSNGSDSVLEFAVTYKRLFVEGDAEYDAWKKAYPIAYLLVEWFYKVKQPCSA